MKFILTGGNTRVLAKTIISFSQIGNDVYLEAKKNGLTLRTINEAQTAFAEINFELSFFIDFKIDRSNPDQYSNKCKISLKSCVDVFENVREVEECLITLNSKTSKLLFLQFFKNFEITHFVYIKKETLRTVRMLDNIPNRVTAPNKLFADTISNFRMYDKEITIEAATDCLLLKNYVDEMDSNEELMETELTLKPKAFLEYRIEAPTEITFCIKALRIIINFCGALSLDMTISFESAGGAVVFTSAYQNQFIAKFVLSSLDESDEMSESCSILTEDFDIDEEMCFPETPPEEAIYESHPSPLSTAMPKAESMSINGCIMNGFTEIATLGKQIICHKSSNARSQCRSPSSIQKTSRTTSIPVIKEKDMESKESFYVTCSDESHFETNRMTQLREERRQRSQQLFAICFEKTRYEKILHNEILAENTDDEDGY